MTGLDRSHINDGNGGDPNPGRGPQFEGYPRPVPRLNGDRGLTINGSDATQPANDNGSVLTPKMLADLAAWKAEDARIGATNERKGAADGGAHLQNSVYKYMNKVLKETGLEQQGWKAYPSVMGSPLDDVGGDIVLINSRTGQMALMDPTSRRLDPATGERKTGADSDKKVPAIREPGVIDALPRWFDKGSGNLEEDQGSPAMNHRVQEFKDDFRGQLLDVTSHAPFNLKDFPLPTWREIKSEVPGQPSKEAASQIQQVIDWSKRKAETVKRSDPIEASLLSKYGDHLGGSKNFNLREGSKALTDAMTRNVDKVMAEEALRRAYPKLAPELQGNQRKFQTLDGGSTISANGGNLVVTLKGKGEGGQDRVVDAGSVGDVFSRRAGYWVGAAGDKQRQEEFKRLLPNSVVKQIDAGTVSLQNIIKQIGENRNTFSAGGDGMEKPMIGQVVGRLAKQKTDGLDRIVTGAATEVTAPAAKAQAPGAEIKASEATRQPVQTNLGRPKPGGEWDKGQAPAPKVGKVDLPKDVPVNGAVVKAAEHGEKPLDAVELSLIQDEVKALEAKGKENLSAHEVEMLNGYRFATRELTKPFGNDPVRCGIMRQLREMWGGAGEARGAAVTVGMLSVIVLNFYQANKGNAQDDSRAKFN